ncbi:MAG: hypothetical protein HN350_02325 [Phycisphaerales bacterium]|nr:hypothetical protein [Phycisphaerales bacterium]
MRRVHWFHFSLLLGAALLCAAVGPQSGFAAEAADQIVETPTTAPADETPATAPDAAALKRGVAALLAVLNADDNLTGLAFPLVHTRKVVDYKDVELEVRYSKKVITIPVWKNIYEKVTELVPVKQSSTIVMKRVTRNKLVKRIKVGERQKEYLARDPKGDIVKPHNLRRPIYGPGGPDVRPVGWVGNNAMVLYTLLAAGVSPSDDRGLDLLAQTLYGHLRSFGIPDNTSDIAWAAAAFARYPGETYDKMTGLLLARLISGQQQSVKARGLWGPLCVNLDHFGVVMAECEKVEKVAAGLTERIKKARKRDDLQDQIDKWQEELKTTRIQIADLFRSVSCNAHRFAAATRASVIDTTLDFEHPGTRASGWPYNLFYETMADLQSTALAVFALRVAHERGKLPKSFRFKHLSGLNRKSLVRPIHTHLALGKTLSKLTAGRGRDGRWGEMIFWGKTLPSRRPKHLKDLPGDLVPRTVVSRRTPICDAQAVGAIEDLLVIMGKSYQKRYGKWLSDARAPVGADMGDLFKLSPLLPRSGHTKPAYYRLFDPVVGGVIEPYDLLHQLRLAPATLAADDPRTTTYARMIEFLTANQGSDGRWTCWDNVFGVGTPALRE